MDMKAMIAEYNKLTGKNIKKFASRAAGEKQLAAARTKAAGAKPDLATALKTKKVKETKPKVVKEKKLNRAASIRESWNDRKVAAARAQRHGVVVLGKTYRSVGAAFVELGLPMGRCIKFRGQVKKDGSGVFEHAEKKYTFKLAPAVEAE